ncbi:unnamed protein product [Durusdinium trenchii]|uniref:JmjC domain-containing protein n=1 Tax=Durusdinium trenchii TaxID=1381693 RepID=A0ABP0IRF3_9DINO
MPPPTRLEIAEPWNYVAEKPSEVIACVCEPGDVLYVPQAWWRSMWNLDDLSLGMGWEGADHGDSDWDEAMHAVADGDLQLLKSLDPQVSQEMMYLAARTGDEEVVAYLLSRLSHPSDIHWGTVAAAAAISGHQSALSLLRKGVASHGTVWHPWVLHAAVLCGQLATVEALLADGAAPKATDALTADESAPDHFIQDGIPWTPLHLACWNGHEDVVNALLKASGGSDLDFVGKETAPVPMWRPASSISAGASPLHLAALRGHPQVLQHLLDAAPELADAVDASEATPLHRAAQGGDMEVVQQLLLQGADPGAKTGDAGLTPWQVAEAHGFPGVTSSSASGGLDEH